METSIVRPHRLKVLGKFKGEIDSVFTMVYLAIDKAGNHWTNPSPSFSSSSNVSTEGWSMVSSQQLEVYRRELFFIPRVKNSLTP